MPCGGDQAGARGGPLRPGRLRPGGEGGAGGEGAVGHHLPPPLRPAEVRQTPRAHRGRRGQVRGMQVLHENRVPRHQHRGRKGGYRQHPLHGLRRVRPAVQI